MPDVPDAGGDPESWNATAVAWFAEFLKKAPVETRKCALLEVCESVTRRGEVEDGKSIEANNQIKKDIVAASTLEEIYCLEEAVRCGTLPVDVRSYKR